MLVKILTPASAFTSAYAAKVVISMMERHIRRLPLDTRKKWRLIRRAQALRRLAATDPDEVTPELLELRLGADYRSHAAYQRFLMERCSLRLLAVA